MDRRRSFFDRLIMINKSKLHGSAENVRLRTHLIQPTRSVGIHEPINSMEPGVSLVSGAPGESDTEEAIVLTDDDVCQAVIQIPAGVAFPFLSYSCHSGGMIDNEKEQIGGGGSTTVGGGGGSAAAAPGGGVIGGGAGGYAVAVLPPHQISINIPSDPFTQILSQRTGQNIQVGNIRTTISDMFGECLASSYIKMIVEMLVKMLLEVLLKMFVKKIST